MVLNWGLTKCLADLEIKSLSVWAYRLKRKYFSKLQRRYEEHRVDMARRLRVLEWRTAQLQQLGLRHIFQVLDQYFIDSGIVLRKNVCDFLWKHHD